MTIRLPVPRPGVYDLYWYFAAERQALFERRREGLSGPWTEDPILQTYKFCNVFRAADRVSQYLIKDICYQQEPCPSADRLFQIVAFRLFSKIETWQTVRAVLGRSPIIDDLGSGVFASALTQAREENGGLYTGAFILCATNAYGQPAKYLNHVELLKHMFIHNALAEDLLLSESLAEVYRLLHDYPLLGDFMSYQIAIDLNYSDLINFSENDFTQAGPGALRGIRKCFLDLGDLKPAEVIHWMVDNQEQEFKRLGLKFSGLGGRALHAIDCQGLFCETDKYCREAAPGLVSARKRIKTRFRQSTDPLHYFFPPKWGIDLPAPAS